MLPERRDLFAGWERADSIVVNPHKWLFTPIDCSVLYTRKPDVLRETFSLVPEYLKTTDTAKVNYMDYGLQLGRRFRALKLWMVMEHYGIDRLRTVIRDHVALAQRLEIHHTPRHGSWLNIAEIELSALTRQCLDRRIADLDTLNTELAAWQHATNADQRQVQWQFTTTDARTKLRHLYPNN